MSLLSDWHLIWKNTLHYGAVQSIAFRCIFYLHVICIAVFEYYILARHFMSFQLAGALVDFSLSSMSNKCKREVLPNLPNSMMPK